MPPSVAQTLSHAGRAAKAGDLAAAEALFRQVLARYPGNRKARAGLKALGRGAAARAAEAQALAAAGHLDAAERKWAAAAARAPGHAAVGLALARCRLDLGRAVDARDAAEAVLAQQPDHAGALDLKGLALRDLGQHDAAAACHRAALGHGAADAAPLNNLGILARASGDLAAAEGIFRQAVALNPGSAHLHHNLARAIRYHAEEPHLAQMQTQLAGFTPGDSAAAPLHFALFKALDELDQRDAAFAHLSEGNRLSKAAQPVDIRREAVRFTFSKQLCAGALPEIAAEGPPGPVFITGLPRSGTTLVERILAQTPEGHACGELQVATTACARLLRRVQARGAAPALTAADIAGLRRDLLAGYAPYARAGRVILDKMPQNFRWIGLLLTALPEARLLHLSRAPLPLAWSLYRHLFTGRGNSFAYDFADIATYMLIHRDLMAFWHRRFPGRIAEIAYADLVSDPGATSRRLVAASGLSWAPACLAPEQAPGPVLTASATQIRQPIYSGSDAAWRRYARQLAPLRAALQLAGVTASDDM